MTETLDTCAALVREHDPDRFFATLFAPSETRGALFALYAFSYEIARIRDVVSDPLPGEVRMQWWREVIEGQGRGNALGHPVAAALMETVAQFNLPTEPLLNLIDARVHDLYSDLFQTTHDLEGYCGETSSALIRLASLVLTKGSDPGPADAAGHAGVAYALIGLLRAFPWHAARGQVYLPQDLFDRHGVTRDDIVQRRGGSGVTAALSDLRELAHDHFKKADSYLPHVPQVARPAFLPLSLAEAYLKKLSKPYDPFTTVIDLPQWRKQWIVWRAAKKTV